MLHGRRELEESIISLSRQVWLDAGGDNLLRSLAEENRELFYKLMSNYDYFFNASKRYEERADLSVSPLFVMETIRYDALHLIRNKQSLFQGSNEELLTTARASIENTNNLDSLMNKLNEVKGAYKPRKGAFRVAHIAQSIFSDTKISGKETEMYKEISYLQAKFRYLTKQGLERKDKGSSSKRENSYEKESTSEEKRSPRSGRSG
jgi:hypothetical protein